MVTESTHPVIRYFIDKLAAEINHPAGDPIPDWARCHTSGDVEIAATP